MSVDQARIAGHFQHPAPRFAGPPLGLSDEQRADTQAANCLVDHEGDDAADRPGPVNSRHDVPIQQTDNRAIALSHQNRLALGCKLFEAKFYAFTIDAISELPDQSDHRGRIVDASLTLARRLVEAHDGAIDVTSTIHVGTQIRVTIPVAPTTKAPAQATS